MSSTSFCPANFEDDDEHILRSAENLLNCDYGDSDRAPRYPAASLPFMRQSSQGEQYYDYENFSSGPMFYQNQYQPAYADRFRGFQKNITTGEKLNQMMDDQNVKNALLSSALNKGTQKNMGPILKLSVFSSENTEYELDQSDIIEVFSRYGRIAQVLLLNQGKAIIVFQDLISAVFAQKSLNGHFINDINVRLLVDWASPSDIRDVRSYLVIPCVEETSYQGPPPGYQPHSQQPLGLNIQYMGHGAQQQQQLPIQQQQFILSQPQASNNQVGNSSNSAYDKEELEPKFQTNFPMKFTCRYEIQIENDKEFQVARKIIGSKGYNMKRIIDLCLKEATAEMRASVDAVKLRLRGRGSGYKEGPDKQESQEPLHLCVSSRFNEVYIIACKLVEELLKNIYDDYENFKARTGRPTDEPLTIKKIECPGGKNPQQTTQASNTVTYPLQQSNQVPQQQQQYQQMQQNSNSSASNSMNNSNCGQGKKSSSSSQNLNNGYHTYIQNFPCLQSSTSSSSNSSTHSVSTSSAFGTKQGSSDSVNLTPTNGQAKKKKSPSPSRDPACEYDKDLKKKAQKEKSKKCCSGNSGSPSFHADENSSSLSNNKDYEYEKGYKNEGIELSELEIKKYVEARNKARRELKFEEADRIRNFLKQKGVALMDEKGGRGKGSEVTTWKFCKKEASRGVNN